MTCIRCKKNIRGKSPNKIKVSFPMGSKRRRAAYIHKKCRLSVPEPTGNIKTIRDLYEAMKMQRGACNVAD